MKGKEKYHLFFQDFLNNSGTNIVVIVVIDYIYFKPYCPPTSCSGPFYVTVTKIDACYDGQDVAKIKVDKCN